MSSVLDREELAPSDVIEGDLFALFALKPRSASGRAHYVRPNQSTHWLKVTHADPALRGS